MYSYEDRLRAVKLYIKQGKRIRPTIGQLGYPTKNALKSWHREYEHSRDLQVRYARARHKYSTQQRQAAVIDLCTRTTSAQAIAQKPAVCRPTLYNGKNQLLGREAPALMKPPNYSESVADKTHLSDPQLLRLSSRSAPKR